jgi:hypothetical protein
MKCPKCRTPLVYVRSEGPADIIQATHYLPLSEARHRDSAALRHRAR